MAKSRVALLKRLVMVVSVGLLLLLLANVFISKAPVFFLGNVVPRTAPSTRTVADMDMTADELAAELNRSQPWLSRRQDWLGHARSCRESRSPLRTTIWQVPCDRGVKVLVWQIPAYNTEPLWRESAEKQRRMDDALVPWAEATKRITGVTSPHGFAPDNKLFFQPDDPFTDDICGIPGWRVLRSKQHARLAEADIVLVDYPYRMTKPENLALIPPARSDQLLALTFSGESADMYEPIVNPSFLSRFNVTLGAPRGWFDYPSGNPYLIRAQALFESESPQLHLIQREGRWPIGKPLIAVAISNCHGATNFRMEYLRELMQYIDIHSYGGCEHNRDWDPAILQRNRQVDSHRHFEGDWRGTKRDTFREYPFVLAFENSNCYDSVTEKPFDALMAGAVPIYMGAPNIEEFLPPQSYIDTRWYASPRELALYIRYLATNPTEQYGHYHAWRGQDWRQWPMVDNQRQHSLCSLLGERHSLVCASSSKRSEPMSINATENAQARPCVPVVSSEPVAAAGAVESERAPAIDQDSLHASSGAHTAWRARLAALAVLGVPSHWNLTDPLHTLTIPLLISRAESNTLIIMYGNSGTIDLMMNAVCHWARLGISNYVIFSHGNTTLATLRSHPNLAGDPATAVLDVRAFFGSELGALDLDSYRNFGDPVFRVISKLKFVVVEALLQLGLHAILQDTDVVPKKDYRAYLVERMCAAIHVAIAGNATALLANSKDANDEICSMSDFSTVASHSMLAAIDSAPSIWIQQEAPWPYAQHNTGFYLIRASSFSLFMMRHLIKMLDHDLGISDQNVFGAFTHDWKTMETERIVRLPFADFPSGYGWNDTQHQHLDAYIVHANWITGIAGKIEKVREAGLFAWDGNAKRCLRMEFGRVVQP